MDDFDRKERRERDKQARAMMAQEKHQEPVPLFGEPVRVSLVNFFFLFCFLNSMLNVISSTVESQ